MSLEHKQCCSVHNSSLILALGIWYNELIFGLGLASCVWHLCDISLCSKHILAHDNECETSASQHMGSGSPALFQANIISATCSLLLPVNSSYMDRY